jgi:hypothetical protein
MVDRTLVRVEGPKQQQNSAAYQYLYLEQFVPMPTALSRWQQS